jgi:hypothetical protein
MTKGKDLAKASVSNAKGAKWEIDTMDAEQRAEAEGIKERAGGRKSRPKIVMQTEGGKRSLNVGDGSIENRTLHSMRLYEAFGSRSNGFIEDAIGRLSMAVRLTGDDEKDSHTLTGAAAVVGAVAPMNELECAMALQMVAANEAALMCFERSRRAEYIEHASAYSNMANKAMRSFALHAEALAKLRRGGEQVVKHVHVNEGGQAVIAGTVHTGGGLGK